METSNELVIVIPAHNEEATIKKVVSDLVCKHKVLVVADNCSDNTHELAEKAGAIVVDSPGLGYQGAINLGMQNAYNMGFKYFVTCDADGQHDNDSILKVAKKLLSKEADIILGVRPEKARFTESILGYYVKKYFGASDILCGLKGYKADVYEKNNKQFSTFESVGTELALRGIVNKFSFSETPIVIHEREDDKPRFGGIVKANLIILKALINIKKYI